MYLLGNSDARVDGLPGPDAGDAWVACTDAGRCKNAKCGDKGDTGRCKSTEPTARKLLGNGDVTVNTSEAAEAAATGDTGTVERWTSGTEVATVGGSVTTGCGIAWMLRAATYSSCVSGSGSSSSKSSSTCSNCAGVGENGDGDGAAACVRVGGGDTNDTGSAAMVRVGGAERTLFDVAGFSLATPSTPARKVAACALLCVITGAVGYTAIRSDTRALTGRVGLGAARVTAGPVPPCVRTAVTAADTAAVAGGSLATA